MDEPAGQNKGREAEERVRWEWEWEWNNLMGVNRRLIHGSAVSGNHRGQSHELYELI